MRRLLLLISAILLLFSGSTLANHSADFLWMGYCCGQRDCVPITVTVMQFGKVDTTVLIHETVLSLPASSVKESEDGHTYWCGFKKGETITRGNTRCVFYTVGG